MKTTRREAAATSKKRRNGVYYTSEEVAESLARWALAKGARRILDPSFGGCAFLRVALRLLTQSGVDRAAQRIYGVDVDRCALPYADDLRQQGVPHTNLIRADFFSTTIDDLGGHRFDAIVGNPPYVRHHLLSRAQTDRARTAGEQAGIQLDRRADLWAYFVAGSLPLLKKQGRLALLLPSAVLHALYAEPLLRALEQRAASLDLIIVREHLFKDALEKTVVLLLDGFDNGSCKRRVHAVRDESGLANLINSLVTGSQLLGKNGTGHYNPAVAGDWKWQMAGLDASRRELFHGVCQTEGIKRLGTVATIRLGIVTGANRFFVRSAADAAAFEGARASSVPVVSRAAWLSTPRWTAEDHHRVELAGRECRLLMIDADRRLPSTLKAAILEAEENGISDRHHCSNREPWFSLRDLAVPDAFLPYMSAAACRLVLNHAGATCTNAIHRVSWNPGFVGAAGVSGAWTSLFRLGAELFGRSYGGGVLKVEPGHASLLPIPSVGTAHDLNDIDSCARTAGPEEATRLADRLVLRDRLGLSAKEVKGLRSAVKALAGSR